MGCYLAGEIDGDGLYVQLCVSYPFSLFFFSFFSFFLFVLFFLGRLNKDNCCLCGCEIKVGA